MKIAPLHPLEEIRLQELNDLEILDTETEQQFDDLVQLASQIANTPISLLSLVDKKRQWFKAGVGLAAKETPRDYAFCAHAILGTEIFEVPDASKDERFADNPLSVDYPNVIFYAGAPIYGPSKMPIGTLCVIDSVPRTLNAQQKSALEKLSNQASYLLQLRNKNRLIIEQNADLQYYRVAVEVMNDGLVLQDQTGAIVKFNPAALAVLRLTEDELLGRKSTDSMWQAIREDSSSFPGEDHPASISLRTGKSQRNVIMGVKAKFESPSWISINSEPIFGPNSNVPTHVVTTFTDITDRKNSEALLFNAAKMSSLGQMAGGIAHEINTPLNVISSNCDYLIDLLDSNEVEPEIFLKKIETIYKTTQRIAAIIRGLRTFARDSSTDPHVEINLQSVLTDCLSFCTEQFRNKGVEIQMQCSKEIYILGDAVRFSQVILNLLSNALDAVKNLNEKIVKILCSVENNTIVTRVIDSGLGIPDAIVDRMMTPFFTTKEVGSGTGLGLSISKGIMESMGGNLSYELYENHTSFVATMPLTKRPQ